MDSSEFISNQGGGFVPGNTDEFTDTTILGISFTFGIPVNSLEGLLDAVGRIGSFLVGQRKRRRGRLQQRFENLAPYGKFPGVDTLFGIFPIIV